jgi:hypothetical protein
MDKIKSIRQKGDLLLIRFGNQVRVFGLESLYDLLIQYDQQISSFTKAHAEALEEISRLKKELKERDNPYSKCNEISSNYLEFCILCDRENLPIISQLQYIKHFGNLDEL